MTFSLICILFRRLLLGLFTLDENTCGLILLCRWRSGRWKAGAQKRLHAVSG